jgi:23S rRNA (cytidine2498-2'-O)-methyltransferase
MIEDFPHTVVIAPKNFYEELLRELGGIIETHGDLVISKNSAADCAWVQDVWLNPVRLSFKSISEAARLLRGLGKHWTLYSVANHRRAALIQSELKKTAIPSRILFPKTPELPPIGAWTLLSPNVILASSKRWKIFPHGAMEFEENKAFPPNRAYLKLWEVFTLLGEKPGKGDLCLDLGSSPGGWTWVLQSLGADVVSVDKADLVPRIRNLPRVTHLRESAFGLDPKRFPKTDWFFSDVICYPERLYNLVQSWLKVGSCRNFVCTVKLQGDTDFEVIRKFKVIPNSQLLHLYHNKHELTWIYPARPSLQIRG